MISVSCYYFLFSFRRITITNYGSVEYIKIHQFHTSNGGLILLINNFIAKRILIIILLTIGKGRTQKFKWIPYK